MGNIGSLKPLEINGQISFKTLDEARQAASQHQGSEAIRQREDGEFEVVAINTTSQFNVDAALARRNSSNVNQEVSFVDIDSHARPELQDTRSLVALSIEVQSGQAADVILNFASKMGESRMDGVVDNFSAKSKELMEKEFRFAPEGSDKWKLYKAMELLAKLNQDPGKIADPEARETLNMRKGQLEDLIRQLNEKPAVQEAYGRIRQVAMRDCGISQTELIQQANYVLSESFQTSLKGKPPEEQKTLIQKELAKIQFFNPEFAQTVAAELGAKTMVDSGLEQYRGLSPEKKAKAKQVVEYLIDDLIKSANTTQDKGLKPLRELQKLASGLPPSQWEAFRKILVNEVFMEEDMEGAIKKAGSLDGKSILKEVEKAEKAGKIKLTDAQKEQIKGIKWHGNLAKILSTAAAVGTGVSIARSVEELQNKGLNFKSAMDLVNKSISMIGATKDIASTGSLLLKTVGATETAETATKAAAFFEGFKLVKWAGPITSAMTAITDGVEAYDRIEKEDQAGAWLKGIGTGAGVVATVAGGAALWTTSATVASCAGPIGLAAVAVVGATAITYNYVKESEETGEFRQDLRKLGISDQADSLEADFQKASEVTQRGPEGEPVIVHDAQKGFAWAKDKPVAERASLIASLMDQATDPYEEEVISLLFKDAVGKNKDANGVDDLDRLVSRTDLRRVGRELQPDQLKPLLASLQTRTSPEGQKALQQLVTGIAADHEYSLLKKPDGSPQDFIKAFPPTAKKEIIEGLMAGYTSGTGETLLSRLVVDLPEQDLAELLGRGGPELVKNLVAEMPQVEAGKLMGRFGDLDRALAQAETEHKAHPSPDSKQKVDVLKHALESPLNNFMMAMSDEANSTFSSYEDTMEKTLTPEITRHLSPESITHICRKLMNTTVWTPDQSSAALVKMLKQTTPEQFKGLMAGATDTFLRKIIAGSTTAEQSKELLQVFLDQAGGKPDRNFQTIAQGMMHQPTVIGMDWNYADVVKAFIQAHPQLDLSATPALRIVTSDHTDATLAGLVRDRGKIAKMSNEEKAIIIQYLMQGWTTDTSETLIHDILRDAHTQDKPSFKELASMIDCYQLANELGDAVISGRGDQESREVLEMLASDADPKDFTAYANRLGSDKNIDVLYAFTARPENLEQIKKLPGPVVKEMCERLMKGYTNSHAEIAITMLLRHANDEALTDALKDKDFASWLTKELQTNDSKIFGSISGDDDQIKTIMQRLGRMAQHVAQAEQKPSASLTADDQTCLAQKPEISASLEAFTLACAQEDYAEVLSTLATSDDTQASVQLLSPPALKAMTESLMVGWASGKDQTAVMDLLAKTTPQQLRELLDKGVGGQALTDKLASKLTMGQLRGLMEKMISDQSVNTGMGFSYLAASLAKEHEGQTLRDLIAQKPQVVRQINPTVLQNMVVSLSKGWTSGESREAIAGILKHATPAQLELILQSNTQDPKHVSDWVVYTLNDGELSAVLENFSKGKGQGRGVEAFLGSLAHDKPAILTGADPAQIKKFNAETLTAAAQDCLKGYKDSTFGGSYKPALDKLLTVAEAKGEPILKTLLEGLDLKTTGSIFSADQTRFNQLLQKVTRLGKDSQFQDFISQAPNGTLMAAWPGLRDSKITLSPAEREALFKKAVDAANFDTAIELLKGVSGSGAASSLMDKPEGQSMVGYLASHLDNFGKDKAIEVGKLVLAAGTPAQIDAAFKKINTGFYFGRGADVVKAVLDSVKSEAEKKAVFGKMPKSTIESLVGTMDSNWYKTIGQITGSYSDNMAYLRDIARLVEPEGKRTMLLALANSWWTPPQAEDLMYNILNDTGFDNDHFYNLINGMSGQEVKLVVENLEGDQKAGTVAGWIGEAEIRKTGSSGNHFAAAAETLSYNHRSEAVNALRSTLASYKDFDKVRPSQIIMMANYLMDGATYASQENAIYELLKTAEWKQFAQVMGNPDFRERLESELGTDQWNNVQKWFREIPLHVK